MKCVAQILYEHKTNSKSVKNIYKALLGTALTDTALLCKVCANVHIPVLQYSPVNSYIMATTTREQQVTNVGTVNYSNTHRGGPSLKIRLHQSRAVTDTPVFKMSHNSVSVHQRCSTVRAALSPNFDTSNRSVVTSKT